VLFGGDLRDVSLQLFCPLGELGARWDRIGFLRIGYRQLKPYVKAESSAMACRGGEYFLGIFQFVDQVVCTIVVLPHAITPPAARHGDLSIK